MKPASLPLALLLACAAPLPAAEAPSEPPHEVFSRLFGNALDYGLWLSPYYWDSAIQTAVYTTSPCCNTWVSGAASTASRFSSGTEFGCSARLGSRYIPAMRSTRATLRAVAPEWWPSVAMAA